MAQYTVDQLFAKLERADAAGDTEAAKVIADEIRRAQSAPNFSGVQGGSSTTEPNPSANNSDFARTITGRRDNGKDSFARQAVENLVGQRGADALDSLQHHALGWLHGSAQLVEHGLNKAGLVGDDTVASDDAAIRRREEDYQSRVPNSPASYVGAAAGEILPYTVGAPARILQGIGAKASAKIGSRLGAKVVSGAAQGSIVGAVQPVTGDNYWTDKAQQVGLGAGTGGAIPIVAAGMRGGANAVRPVLSPQKVANQQLVRMLGADASTLQKIDNAPFYFTGEQPTLAQILQTPRAVQVEKALANRPDVKTLLTEQSNANNQGRVGIVRRLAGTDEELQGAVAKRRAEARAFTQEALVPGAENARYSRASQQIADFLQSRKMNMTEYKVMDEARKILGRVQRGTIDEKTAAAQLAEIKPATKSAKVALEQALTTVNRNMVGVASLRKQLSVLSGSGNPTISGAAKRHLSLLDEHADTTGRVPAYVLDDMRQNIGAMLAKDAPNGVVGSQEQAIYGPVASKIISSLDRSIPGYRGYLAAYRANSAPINTMEAARRILGPVDQRGLNSDGAGRLTLAQLNAGLNRIDKSRYGITPEARQEIEGLRQSLRRESVSDSIRSPGSDTAYNLQSEGWLARQLYGPAMEGPTKTGYGVTAGLGALIGHAVAPGVLGQAGGAGLAAGLKKGAQAVNERIAAKVAKGMSDPHEARRMIEAYLTQNPKDAPALLKAYPQWAALISEQ